MIIQYSPYTLRPRTVLNAAQGGVAKTRQGVLLKVTWPDGRIGYSDLHPWEELGDKNLSEQLQDLKAGRLSYQLEQSLWLANRDSHLRQAGKSIFDEGIKVINNYILTDYLSAPDGLVDEIKQQKFNTVKLKVGMNLDSEIEFIARLASANFQVRLDFNSVGSLKIFEKFYNKLTPLARASIEYVEDPFRYNYEQWMQASQMLPLAMDNEVHAVDWSQETEPLPFGTLVLKPAKCDVNTYLKWAQNFNLKIAVTSYMDHPVGVIHAVGVAMELQRDYPEVMLEAGCMTHALYQLDEYSAQIDCSGPYFKRVTGTGVGFDNLLAKAQWLNL
ncbi:MAG: hypothetical protein ACLGGX_04325 [Bdellovibrionia bacterium]